MSKVFYHLMLAVLTGISAASAHAVALDLSKDVVVCAKETGYNRYKFVLVQKSKSLVYYESSSGGSQAEKCNIIRSDRHGLVISHYDGINQTVSIDAHSGIGIWAETYNQFNREIYQTCASFDRYDTKAIAAWLKSSGIVR